MSQRIESQMVEFNQIYDLVILGAGPAGISTALHLHQLDPGWSDRMLVLEMAEHPRHKLCGGGLTKFGHRVLMQLGFGFPLPIPSVEINQLLLVYGEKSFYARGDPLVEVYQRSVLDEYLVKQAKTRGVVIRENERVLALQYDKDGILVKTTKNTYLARVVVGADGSKGISRRFATQGQGTQRTARTLETFQPVEPWGLSGSSPEIVFDFTPVSNNLQGYFWRIPMLLSGAPFENRGVYDARYYAGKQRADLPGILAEQNKALADEHEVSPIESHPIHLFSPRNLFAAERILLVGDAAGADPLFGEGIGPALGYGAPAARAIQWAFQQGDFAFKNYRRRVLWSPVGRYLLWRYSLARGGYFYSDSPWFMNLVWRIGQIVEKIVQ